jgi:signal transduction histidine kinase
VSVLFSINYLSENQTNFEFLKFFTVFLLMITVIFSILIIFLNKTLQSDLKIKTSELDHISQEIIKSEKLSAIGQLSSRMAHDIRNPLTIIRISLENIKLNYGVNESQDKSFKKIVRSIDRITHQIDGVLDFVKGHTPLLRTVKFSEIIADSIDSLVIPDDLELITPKNDVTFLVDKRLFTVAMINLILNAIQAVNNKGTIEITIEENKDTVIIQVKDSGIGISSENLDKIFEPLFTTKLSGTGLGLVGVKSIIESHQGKISVTSPPTVFTISLPKIIEEIDD